MLHQRLLWGQWCSAVRQFVECAGPSLRQSRECALKRCIPQLEALLLLQEPAALTARSEQEHGPSINGQCFIALAGPGSGLFLSPTAISSINPVQH